MVALRHPVRIFDRAWWTRADATPDKSSRRLSTVRAAASGCCRFSCVSASRAPTVRLVQLVPLLGFDLAGGRSVDLGAGLGIRLMSDAEPSAVVDAGLRDQAGGSIQYREVSRFYRCALVRHSTHPVRAGAGLAAATPPTRLDECARRLLIALRLVCGGSVVLPRHGPWHRCAPCSF